MNEETPENNGDVLDSLLKRHAETTAERLDQRMKEAGQIKRNEEAASKTRLEDMWEREYERQRSIARAKEEQKKEEELILRAVLVSVAVLLIAVIVLTAILTL